jgi:hypothetical protein
VLGVGLRLRRVAVEPVGDLREAQQDLGRLLLGQPRGSRGRRERRLDEPAVLVVDRLGRRRGRAGGARERERRG